ncbi:MAG: glycosyltransferase [Elusimicrobia bacterium]|nr:glycosyltransferase [Elusimicrobiota bacterium]MBD3412281.1 glycosyltransferase [Elusimicrobiota bacterium]
MMVLLIIILSFGYAYWTVQFLSALLILRKIKNLDDIPAKEHPLWPKISIIIPARNEEKTIEPALKTKLHSTYPNLEIIVVDDRSHDATPAILNGLAQTDPRLRVITISELPYDWMGKPYAMQQGFSASTGDWLLFTDADVFVSNQTLKKIITFVTDNQCEFVTIIPEFWSKNFILDILFAHFLRTLSVAGRLWAVPNKQSKAAAGAGAFNFVNRSAFAKTGGFAWLKYELVDDVALGQMMKKSGVSCAVLNGRRHVGLYFYGSLKHAITAAERIVYTPLGKNPIVLSIMACLIMIVETAPMIVFFSWSHYFILYASTLLFLLAAGTGIMLNKWFGRSMVTAFFFPVHACISAYSIARGVLCAYMHKGLIWRGRLYPADKLRQGSRLEFL